MKSLYHDLAGLYDIMYSYFIDYDEEYRFYSEYLDLNHKSSLLELGCGTGRLAHRFQQAGYDYAGMDISDSMLKIARKRCPELLFYKGDMTAFSSESPKEAIIMVGRTISYLLHDSEVTDMMKSCHNNLTSGGLFCFDFIDSLRLKPDIGDRMQLTHDVSHNGQKYIRESTWTLDHGDGDEIIWNSIFYMDSHNKVIGRDHSTIRIYSLDEMNRFLNVGGFTVLDVVDKSSYAFPTYAVICRCDS